MHWWEEAEARAHRARTAAALADTYWQRLQSSGLDKELTYAPAYDLAVLYDLCADYVKIVDALLLITDGDLGGMKRQAQVLARWLGRAGQWIQASGSAVNQLLDTLDLDPERLAAREEVDQSPHSSARPDEAAKLEGRFRHYHLLYERLDLKLASVAITEQVRLGLARGLAHLYEQSLLTIRALTGLERESRPRLGVVTRLLLDLNTTWHFDLGPYVVAPGEIRLRGIGGPGLPTWLLLAFGA